MALGSACWETGSFGVLAARRGFRTVQCGAAGLCARIQTHSHAALTPSRVGSAQSPLLSFAVVLAVVVVVVEPKYACSAHTSEPSASHKAPARASARLPHSTPLSLWETNNTRTSAHEQASERLLSLSSVVSIDRLSVWFPSERSEVLAREPIAD